MTIESDNYDVIVVGGRCAGAATGMLLARGGARVLVLERSVRGSDTLSTHALMRGGVVQLERWGLLPAVRGIAQPVAKTTFHYGDREPIVVPVKPRGGIEALYAPRRTYLDALLSHTASGDGAEVVHGVRVEGLVHTADGRVVGVRARGPHGLRELRAGLVVGADGVRSLVASQTRAPVYRVARHSMTTVYAYFEGVPNAGYRWYFDRGVGAGAIPTSDGLTCVFSGASARDFASRVKPDPEAGFWEMLAAAAPQLVPELRAHRRRGGLHTFAGAPGHLRRPRGPGWALVGDAGYFRDPLTAHGITDALRDAELLARAYLAGGEAGLRDYQWQRDDLARPFFDLTERIASMHWGLDGLMEMHGRLSLEMKREAAMLAGLPAGLQLAA